MSLAIVDAHHHLWDLERRSYPFLEAPEHEPIRHNFDLTDLAAAVTPHGIAQTVVVQAAPDLAETEALLDVAAASPLIAAVVGWIGFGTADAAGQLDRLLAHPHAHWLAGLRAMAQDHPDPDWLASAAVSRTAAEVGAAGLVCELLITPREAAAAHTLVRRLPDVRFMIDHAGKPPIAGGATEPWATGMRALAGAPNTACKISGLVTEANWRAWTEDQIAAFVELVVEAFGEDRLLFGSDWPVCLLAASYEQVLELARRTLSALATEKVFAGNAQRAYGLGDSAEQR